MSTKLHGMEEERIIMVSIANRRLLVLCLILDIDDSE
jgi:hypothetical protein